MPDPISYSDIDAWQRLTQTVIRPEEVEILTLMDTSWMRAIADHRKEQEKDQKKDAK